MFRDRAEKHDIMSKSDTETQTWQPVEQRPRVRRVARQIAIEDERKKREPKRHPNESAAHYKERLSNWLIEDTFERLAKPKMHGEGHKRSAAWRIAEAERSMTLDEDEYW